MRTGDAASLLTMRRLVALLVLLAGSHAWTASLACPMDTADAAATLPTAHVHDGPPDEDAGPHRSPTPGDAGCRVVMSCAGAVLVTPAAIASRAAPVSTAARVLLDDLAWTTIVLPHDTPPPRLPV